MFGVPLEVAVQRSIVVDGIELPTVFRQCIDFLEENGEVVYSSYVVMSGHPWVLLQPFGSRACIGCQASSLK